MSKTIEESGVTFGPFAEEKLFHIEKSAIYQQLGEGIKSVEFVLCRKKNILIFLEAKTTCPNAATRDRSAEAKARYEAFYADVAQKIEDSVKLTLAALLGRFADVNDIGDFIHNCDLSSTKLKFILVITTPKATELWLPGPKAELERRLLSLRKIWKLDVVVLNQQMAIDAGLIIDERGRL